ncbi:hypothetical protein LINGRAHAP2_LOCUS35030 [Linum grandiflorum]
MRIWGIFIEINFLTVQKLQ